MDFSIVRLLAFAVRNDLCRRYGESIVAASGGVKPVPKEIGVEVDGLALRTVRNVYQRVEGRRSYDFVEERVNIQLR